jgi:hypothetical protein
VGDDLDGTLKTDSQQHADRCRWGRWMGRVQLHSREASYSQALLNHTSDALDQNPLLFVHKPCTMLSLTSCHSAEHH